MFLPFQFFPNGHTQHPVFYVRLSAVHRECPVFLSRFHTFHGTCGHSVRINTLVTDLINVSREAGCIQLSPEVEKALKDLRSFMFEKVYRSPVAKAEESKAKAMLCRLFEYYMKHPDALPEDFHPQLSFEGMERTVCDYVAGMTDNYAVDKFTEIFIPAGWNVRG